MQEVADQSTVDEVTRRFWVPPLWLMLLVFLLVLLFAGHALVWHPLQVRNSISRRIQNLGGSVKYEEHGPDWVRWLTGFRRSTHPVYVKQGGILDQVSEVRICASGQPPGKRREISSELIGDLQSFHSLKRLDLNYTNVTDDWLPAIAQLRLLERLDLGHARISGRGFHQLKKLSHLNQLDLVYCPVRKQYLDELVELRSLKHLNLYRCSHLTLEDVEAFETARPDVKVNFHVRNHP